MDFTPPQLGSIAKMTKKYGHHGLCDVVWSACTTELADLHPLEGNTSAQYRGL